MTYNMRDVRVVNPTRLFLGSLVLGAGLPATQLPSAMASSLQESAPEQVSIAFGSELNTLDPAFFTSSNEQTLFRHLFDTLVTRDEDLQFIPCLAESWEAVDDTTWEFRLRTDVTFHDGTPMTSEDVKFTFDRILGDFMENPSQSKLSTIAEVEVVDAATVRILTVAPDPILLARLSGIVSWIVPKAYIEEIGFEQFAVNPIGTGPYRFSHWEKDEELVIERYDEYWQGQPPVARIRFQPVPEASTRLALLQSGDIDFTQSVPPDQVAAVEGIDGVELVSTPSLRSMYLILRSDSEPLNDVRIRQAINYALDKEGIVNELLDGHGIVSPGQTMGPEYFGFHPGLEAYPYDPDRARELLAEAGVEDGLTIEFLTPSGRYQQDRTVAEAVAAQLSAVGIQVNLEAVEYGVYVTRKLDRTIAPITLGAWSQPVYDADGVVYLLYHTDEPWGVHYSNARVDELSELARETLDEQARLDLYHEALEIIREDAPVAFLHQMNDLHGRRVGAPILPLSDESIIVYAKW